MSFFVSGLPRRIICVGWIAVGASAAHHSVAGFDRNKLEAVTGTVDKFVWSNPHSWIYLKVPDGKGGTQEWPLEGTSVAELSHAGWRPDTLKPGDVARIKVAPRRDGQPGGEYLAIFTVNGEPFKLAK